MDEMIYMPIYLGGDYFQMIILGDKAGNPIPNELVKNRENSNTCILSVKGKKENDNLNINNIIKTNCYTSINEYFLH